MAMKIELAKTGVKFGHCADPELGPMEGAADGHVPPPQDGGEVEKEGGRRRREQQEKEQCKGQGKKLASEKFFAFNSRN